MKIKFTEICEIENSSMEDIKTTLYQKLHKLKADNINKKNDGVSFKNDFWKGGSVVSLMADIDSGFFKLIKKNNLIKIYCTYNISLFGSLILFCVFLLIGLFIEPFLFFGSGLIILNFIRKINNAKDGIAQLLLSIKNQN